MSTDPMISGERDPIAAHVREGSARRAVMIAFNFPPALGSSGVLRSVTFARHLAESGWQCTVLTASRHAHAQISEGPDSGVLPGVDVLRSWALDAARHLSVRGKFIGWTARPDRWANWYLSATPSGIFECWRRKPDVIWSTYPIPTAHRIALTLHRVTGIPWIADFRDPLVSGTARGQSSGASAALERKVVEHASVLVFVSESARAACMHRHPDKDPSSFVVIENGFDEKLFEAAEKMPLPRPEAGRFRILHSGTVYRDGRSPIGLLDALQVMAGTCTDLVGRIEVVFRASTVDAWLEEEIRRRRLEHLVRLAPAIGYQDAVREMIAGDGLLVLQGREFNQQIPAKAYECLRAGKPILGLADSAGETWRLLSSFDSVYMAPIDDVPEITATLTRFLDERAARTAAVPDRSHVHAYSRQNGADRLCALFGQLVKPRK